MSACCVETCIYWTGHGCACEVMGIEPESYDEEGPTDE